MKYTKIILLFVLILFVGHSFAQDYRRNLNWQTNQTMISPSGENIKVLYFTGSALFDNSLLPYFSENINIQKNYKPGYSYSVKLENPEYIALSSEDLKVNFDAEAIHEKINLEYNVFHARGIPYMQIKFLPLKKDKNGTIYKLVKFELKIDETGQAKSLNKKQVNATNSVLSSGTWKRIRIKKSGVYKITYAQLESMGFSNPQNIRIFGNASGWLPMIAGEERPDDLVENDILKKDNAVFFYGQGPDRWDYDEGKNRFVPVHHYYSEYAYYYLTTDVNTGYDNAIKNINSVSLPENKTITEYDAYAVYEQDLTHIEKTGRRMYGELFDVNTNQAFNFSFPGLSASGNSSVYIRTASNSSSSYIRANVNGSTKTIRFGSIDKYSFASIGIADFSFTAPSGNSLNVNLNFHQSSPAAQAWLDYIYINTKCRLSYPGAQFRFRNAETAGAGIVSKYVLSGASNNITVWDISEKTRPRKVVASAENNSLSFKMNGDVLREFAAFDNSSVFTPDFDNVQDVPNQNLHATAGTTDMIIVTYSGFLEQAEKLKRFHEEKDNMKIKVVTEQEVFNEFSSGAPDFSAIRDYAKMVYERAADGDTLRYLCLFGDGSYDNRSGAGVNGNYMITYQQSNSVSIGYSLVTDDFFGMLDDGEGDVGTSLNGLLDIGVGRIPVSEVEQAEDYLAKIYHYTDPATLGDWRNQLCFIADDEDSKIHMIQADGFTKSIKEKYPAFNIQKIYLDAYTQYSESGGQRYPDVNTAINNRIQKGALLINYTGHGGEEVLAHERIVTINEIDSWRNFDKLPLFVTATCEFTRFDDYKFVSAGEHVFLNPKGGAIAMFTTARIAYIHANGTLSRYFYKNIFERFDNGEICRLGDVIRKTKVDYSSKDILIFFLLGDPALQLGYASDNHQIITEKINATTITQMDTLKALSKASFSGYVADKNGNKLNDFNGYIYPTVFDKETTVNTLDNDGEGVFTFNDRNNIVYKGKTKVINGDFKFEFIVPKDILLNIDTGKVSYYAENGVFDIKGYSFDFLVGDIANDYEEDNVGPEIKLYMNDENFVSGGMTDKNPRIFAKLFDEHGINTASGGIGHDITAVIDNNINNIIVMNDGYRADEGTYKSGTLEHGLFDLEPGEHSLKFKAWDVYNNSSEEYLDFVVVESEKLSLEKLLNYPNPFTTHTDFWFEHNQIGQEIDLVIHIFTVSGKLVKTIEDHFTADGYRAGPYPWDGTDDFGNRIGRGVYMYQVKLRSSSGETAEKFEKLLILK